MISYYDKRGSLMKVGLDRQSIVEAAADMADKKGFANLTMKLLAGELGVKSPSLYKHFGGGLEELNRELMLYGWRSLESEITTAAVGKAKDDAIIAICRAYRSFVSRRRGLFEAMQWYNMYQSEEHLKATEGTIAVLFRVLEAYGLSEEQKVHSIRMLRGFLQGFSAIESHGGFGNPTPLDDTFDFALKTILNGIRNLIDGGAK